MLEEQTQDQTCQSQTHLDCPLQVVTIQKAEGGGTGSAISSCFDSTGKPETFCACPYSHGNPSSDSQLVHAWYCSYLR